MWAIQAERCWRRVSVFHAIFTAHLLAIGGSGCSDTGRRAEAAPSPGSALNHSSLRLLDLDDQRFDLAKNGPGHVHVAIFTRSDCPVSNRFAPEVRKLFDEFHSKGADFYLVYVDPSEKPQAIRDHLRQYEYACPGLRDPEHTLVAQTGATVTPEAVVFDRNWQMTYRGRINDQYEDLGKARANSNKHDLRDAIEATLAGQPVAEPITKAVGCYIGDLK
jgi:peroxiredoxin